MRRTPWRNSFGARSYDEPALALHGLDHDRSHLLRGDLRHERALEVGERLGRRRPAVVLREGNPVDLGRERTEPRLVRMRLRRQRHREQRAAVESAFECDHGRSLRVRARELDRVLDGLGAGVEERRLRRTAERRQRDEPFRERHVRLVRDDREVRVEEARGLLLHCVDDARVRVADVEAADAAGEVDERVPVDVGERRAFAALDHDGEEDRERVGDDAVLPGEDLLRSRPRNCGLQLDRLGRRHRLSV